MLPMWSCVRISDQVCRFHLSLSCSSLTYFANHGVAIVWTGLDLGVLDMLKTSFEEFESFCL